MLSATDTPQVKHVVNATTLRCLWSGARLPFENGTPCGVQNQPAQQGLQTQEAIRVVAFVFCSSGWRHP